MPFYGLLFPSTRVTLPQLDLPQIIFSHFTPTQLTCVFYFYLLSLSSVLFLTLLTYPTHSYLQLIFHDCESAYSFYIYLLLYLLLGYGLYARPALNMYVYRCLVSAVGIPQT